MSIKALHITALSLLIAAAAHARAYGDIDSADADYCHCVDSEKVGETSTARLLLVKRNNSLKPIVLKNTLKMLCTGNSTSGSHGASEATLKDTSGKEFVTFRRLGGGWGMSTLCIDCVSTEEERALSRARRREEAVLESPPTHSVDVKDELNTAWALFDYGDLLEYEKKVNSKEYWRQFKNKIIDVRTTISYKCEPEFDSTYHYNYRARIIGECDSATIVRHRKP